MSEEISKSKQKREARKEEVKKEKAKKNLNKIVSWTVGIIIAAVVIAVIGLGIYSSLDKVTPSSDFSRYMDENGFVVGADLNSVKDLSLETLHIDLSEVDYTDEDVQSDIDAALSANSFYNEDETLTVKDGDSINLDYVGYVDGVAFDGGNTNGNGAYLTIGSHNYIDDFEEQLIGSHPGESVIVNVTFPEDYGTDELNGKDAVFECVINSILSTPELTDEFVKTNYPEYGSTVQELKDHYKAEGYNANLRSYLTDYIQENAEASKLPGKYTKQSRGTICYIDQETYVSYSNIYTSFYGYNPFPTFNDYTGMSDEEYAAYVKEQAKTRTAIDMTYEKVYRDNNLSIDEDYLASVKEGYTEDELASFGEPYFKQVAIKNAVIEFLAGKVTVE